MSSVRNQLALIDRKGGVEALKLPSGPYEHPRVSPDGKRIAFGTDDGKEANVWIYDLSGATAMRRLTFGGRNRFPIWSADGQRVAFQSDREGRSWHLLAGRRWQRDNGTAHKAGTRNLSCSRIVVAEGRDVFVQCDQRLQCVPVDVLAAGQESDAVWRPAFNGSHQFGVFARRPMAGLHLDPDPGAPCRCSFRRFPVPAPSTKLQLERFIRSGHQTERNCFSRRRGS